METIGTWWMWAGFAVFVVVAIAIDLLVMERQGAHKVTMKEAVRWSLLWFSLAFVFVAILWWYLDGSQGREVANTVSMQFITGYLVEKSLSIDNIFVFLMLFSYFAVPPQYQKRALIIGIIGAIVLRTLLILVGAWLLATFHWLLYVFGAFLVFTGAKMWFAAGQEPDIATNPVLTLLKKRMRITDRFDGEKLSTMIDGVKHYTPLFVVLVLIGTTDIIFAVDSIPPSSPSPATRSSCSRPTSSRSWVCVRCTSCWQTWPTASTCWRMAWPWCWCSSAARCCSSTW